MPFKDWERDNAPGWLQTERGSAFLEQRGAVRDELVARLKLAVKARFPGLSAEDALVEVGAERGIPRGPGESNSQYSARVIDAWESWLWAGVPYGMLRAFRAAGYTNVKLVIVQGREYALDANGDLVVTELADGSWAIDATPQFWNKFQVLFPDPSPWDPGAPPAESSAEANFIRQIIHAWKAGHARFSGVVVQNGENLWGYPYETWAERAARTWGSSDDVVLWEGE